MKKLRSLILHSLCIFVLAGCHHYGNGDKVEEHTQEQGTNQPIKRLEEQQPATDQQSVAEASSNPVKIALLVPLSGTYKDLGQGLLDAAQLAIFRIGDSNLTLIPVDSKDTPAGAAMAAKKAIDSGAKIILGPVFSTSAKAIAKIAAGNNIQVVSFSNDKTLAGTGVFAIGFMPDQQLNRITEFALARDIKEITTILPSDAYGTNVSKTLREIVDAKNQGVTIRNEEYKTVGKKAFQLDEHVRAALAKASESKIPPSQKAILFPAGWDNTQQAIALLTVSGFDKTKLQVLGSDQFNEPAILQNPAVDGAWFTAMPRERRAEYENKFKEVYGYDAPKLSSLSYDGISLAATILKISGGETFSREQLTNPRGFIGVDGIFRLRDDGLAERGLAVMVVHGGRAVMLDPAPTAFIGN